MEKTYSVKNRSSNKVIYRLPEMNIRREFAPGEIKKISHEELEKLTYRPGGVYMIQNYFQISDIEAAKELSGQNLEPEYHLDEAGVKDLLLNGSLDAFLDALDFAPEGVIDLIKKIAVDLPLADINKINAIKKKTNFDVSAAVRHNQEDKIEEIPDNAPASKRRVQTGEAEANGRRTTSKYNIVSKENN